MSYGYKTILELDGEEYDIQAFSYSFEKDIDEYGKVTSAIKDSGYIYVTLTAIPDRTLLEWAVNSKSYKGGAIKVVDIAEEASIPDEELSFEFGACTGMKLTYENSHGGGYFTTIFTISAMNLRVGVTSWINKSWGK